MNVFGGGENICRVFIKQQVQFKKKTRWIQIPNRLQSEGKKLSAVARLAPRC